MGRIVIWIVGLGLLSLIFVAAIHFKADDIEYELQERSNLALIKHDILWATVIVNGRDAILEGIAPDTHAIKVAEKTIRSLWGIRIVDCRCEISKQNSEIKKQTGTVKKQPQPDQAPIPLDIKQKTKPVKEKVVVSSEPIVKTEPVAKPEKVGKTLLEECQIKIDQVLKNNSIVFAFGSSTISSESFPLLDKLVAITKDCPDSRLEVSGHTDNIGDDDRNFSISLDRAQSIIDYFQASGVKGDRLKAIGYGSSSPIDTNDTEEGRRRNRRIEIHVIP